MYTVVYSSNDPVALMATKLLLKEHPDYAFDPKKNIIRFLSEMQIDLDVKTIVVGLSVNYKQIPNENGEIIEWITPFTNGNEPNSNNIIHKGSSQYYNDSLSIVEELTNTTLRLKSGRSVSEILMRVNTLTGTPESSDTMFLLNKLDHNKIPASIDDNYVIQSWGSFPLDEDTLRLSTQPLTLNGVNVIVADSSISYDEAKTLVGAQDGLLYLDFSLKGKSVVKLVFKNESDIEDVIEYLKQHDFYGFKVTGTTGYGLLPLSWLDILLTEGD